MTLDDTIRYLKGVRAHYGGGITVFVNGEYGEGEPKKAQECHFTTGEAEITLGGDINDIPGSVNPRDIVMQIGG